MPVLQVDPWHAAGVAQATECPTCGAPDGTGGAECVYCGAPLTTRPEPADAPLEGRGSATGTVPDDLPPAREARRFQGWAVPAAAAAVVLGIGLPLTALAVSQVDRLPAGLGTAADRGSSEPTVPPPGPRGTARLNGAVTFDGAALPLGCRAGTPPKIATIERGADKYSILVTVPVGAGAGSYPLQAATGTFVAVTRLAGGSQTWTSLNQAGATGAVTVAADGSLKAEFSGLAPVGGGAEGTVNGVLEAGCG